MTLPRHFEITTLSDWERLLDAVAGFHDGVVRQALVTGDVHVTPSRSMLWERDPALASVKLFVQLQHPGVAAVELTFSDAWRLCFQPETSIDPARATALDKGFRFELLEVVVEAPRAEAVVLGRDALGAQARWALVSTPGRLDATELVLLEDVVARRAPALVELARAAGEQSLDKSARARLGEALADELTSEGLGSDLQPNAYGARIESLLDRILSG